MACFIDEFVEPVEETSHREAEANPQRMCNGGAYSIAVERVRVAETLR